MVEADHVAERALDGLGRGDHACCTVGGRAGVPAGLVSRFARDAFAARHRMIYVADGTAPEDVRGWLARGGVDVGAREAAGALEVRRSVDLYADDAFDPAATVTAVLAERDAARADGFAGLSIMAEMSWATRTLGDIEPLVDYERRVQQAFAGGDLRGLCQYDAARIDPDVLAEIASGHDARFSLGPGWVSASRAALTVSHAAGDPVRLAGDLDLAATGFLRARLAPLLEDDEGDVAIDGAALDYLDVSGGRELLRFATELGARGRRLRLTRLAPLVRQVLALCGADRHPHLVLA